LYNVGNLLEINWGSKKPHHILLNKTSLLLILTLSDCLIFKNKKVENLKIIIVKYYCKYTEI